MNIDFKNIEYLKIGNKKQKHAYNILMQHNIFTILKNFDPILVGTIPIRIDIEKSDLDVICYFKDQDEFINKIQKEFYNFEKFSIRIKNEIETKTVIVNFWIDNFEIEIYGQNVPAEKQFAYRHMLIEYKLLCKYGENFRNQIIEIKKQGYKTEPAFGKVLGLKRNPYIELLSFEK